MRLLGVTVQQVARLCNLSLTLLLTLLLTLTLTLLLTITLSWPGGARPVQPVQGAHHRAGAAAV